MIILAQIAAGVAIGVALGETISVGLLASAVVTGIAQAGAFGQKYLSWGDNLFGEPEVSADFIDALGAFDDGGGATIDDVVNSPGVPVFTPGGELVALEEDPTNPAALSSGGGIGLLLAAAAALTFVI